MSRFCQKRNCFFYYVQKVMNVSLKHYKKPWRNFRRILVSSSGNKWTNKMAKVIYCLKIQEDFIEQRNDWRRSCHLNQPCSFKILGSSPKTSKLYKLTYLKIQNCSFCPSEIIIHIFHICVTFLMRWSHDVSIYFKFPFRYMFWGNVQIFKFLSLQMIIKPY